MSKIVTLSSQTSADITSRFSQPVIVKETMEVALHSAFLWYSFFNVSTAYTNTTISYNNGTVDRVVTFPNGNYTVSQLQTELHIQMKAFGDLTIAGDGTETYDIMFNPNYSTLRLEIVLTNSYTVDLTTSKFHELIGFTSKVVNSSEYGTALVDITRGVDNLFINCDLVSESYTNGVQNQVLYSFRPNVPPGSSITIEPVSKIFVPITISGQLTSVRVWVTDQNFNPISFNTEGATFMLHLRPMRSNSPHHIAI